VFKIAIIAITTIIPVQYSNYNRGYNDGESDSRYMQQIEQSNIDARQQQERWERERQTQRDDAYRQRQESFEREQREEELESLRRRLR
jgi:hypothetical protein